MRYHEFVKKEFPEEYEMTKLMIMSHFEHDFKTDLGIYLFIASCFLFISFLWLLDPLNPGLLFVLGGMFVLFYLAFQIFYRHLRVQRGLTPYKLKGDSK